MLAILSSNWPFTELRSKYLINMRRFLISVHRFMSTFLVDPIRLWANYTALPVFVRNYWLYKKLSRGKTSFSTRDSSWHFTTYDRFLPAGSIHHHYFFQDLWAACEIVQQKVTHHTDIGSRLDGFVAHLLPFCQVNYVDIRPLASSVANLKFTQGSILSLPFEDNTLSSLSCLHVIEHIGLGRYGDPVDPDGHAKAARELARVLAPGGRLYVGTPTGKEKLYFDAHRVFNPQTIIQLFNELDFISFHLIDDRAQGVIENASFDQALACSYGCGLYVFSKTAK